MIFHGFGLSVVMISEVSGRRPVPFLLLTIVVIWSVTQIIGLDLGHLEYFGEAESGLVTISVFVLGVLFYDPDNTGELTEKRQYVFTEWDPTATSDIEALRSVFDSSNDGVFDASDDEWSIFKVMVTNADRSKSPRGPRLSMAKTCVEMLLLGKARTVPISSLNDKVKTAIRLLKFKTQPRTRQMQTNQMGVCLLVISLCLLSCSSKALAEPFSKDIGSELELVSVVNEKFDPEYKFADIILSLDVNGVLLNSESVEYFTDINVFVFLLGDWDELDTLPWQESMATEYKLVKEAIRKLGEGRGLVEYVTKTVYSLGRHRLAIFYNFGNADDVSLVCVAKEVLSTITKELSERVSLIENCYK